MSINIPRKLTTPRTISDTAAGYSTATHSTAKLRGEMLSQGTF